MRLAALYALILTVALGAWTAINLLWSPDIIAWDPDAYMVVGVICLFGAVGAGSGLGTLVPQQGLPKPLQGFPATTGAAVGGFVIFWATKLVPPFSAKDWTHLAAAVGGALAIALLSAVLHHVFPEPDRGALADGKPRHRLFLGSLAGAVVLAAAFLIYRALRA